MDNYSKIKALLEAGHIVECKRDQDFFYLFSSIRCDGSFRVSISNSLSLAYDNLGSVPIKDRQVDEINFDYIRPYVRKVWYPKAGDKVMILESVKESPGYENWFEKHKEMVGGPFEVKQCGVYCEVFVEDKSDYFRFDYRHLAPWIEEETETEVVCPESETHKTIVIDGVEYNLVPKS